MCQSNLAGGGATAVPALKAFETKKRLTSLSVVSWTLMVPGVLLEMLGGDRPGATHASPLPFLGVALVIAGLCVYATAKGRSFAWGFMGIVPCLGFILGLVVIGLMNKICQHCGRPGGKNAIQCDACRCPM